MGNSAASRARADLEKQLVELSRLRNANTRDPDFKVWRQATLTLIQRIWEGDDSRSARFRAIPFSPGTTRPDPKLARDWFERGCAEAARVLRELIEEINQHGIIKGPSAAISGPEPLPDDDNVPMLSLDASETSGASSIPDEPDDLRLSEDDDDSDDDSDDDEEEIFDIPDPPGARPPKPVSRPMGKTTVRSDSSAKAPKPAAKPPAPVESGPAAKPEPTIPISETAPPGPSRGVTVSNGGSKSGGKKPPARDRLKDMLGFEPGSSYSPPAETSRPAAAAPAPPKPMAERPSAPSEPEEKAPARPAPTHASRPASPAARNPAPPPRAAAPRREAPAPPPDLERNEGFGTIAPESVAPLGEGRPSDDFPLRPATPARPARPAPQAQSRPAPAAPARPAPQARSQPPAEPGPKIPTDITPLPLPSGPASSPPDAEPWPIEPPADNRGMGAPLGYDENTLKRAFEAALQSFARRRKVNEPEPEPAELAEASEEDLLGQSPVFNVTAKPVKRRGHEPDGRYHTATGIAMAAIATEVEAMGVPATDCSRARAALLELADHFERRDLTWDTVRDAVRLLIAYPVVARRVLPLLVPHLDEAA